MSDNFIKSNFHWFTGVIEDINDPEEMGRYRVRCFGYHTDDRQLLSTEDLPWAHVMMPITSASVSGIGHSATGLLQGSWVVGFFRDGDNAQDPVVMGSLPSMTAPPDHSFGFNDPSGHYPHKDSLGEVDTPQMSRSDYTENQSFVKKTDLRVDEVYTAKPPSVSTIANDKEEPYYDPITWSNNKTEEIIQPVYPKNHVTETESGHVFEVDDTPNAERISTMHTSGTYEEIVANGDKTVTVVGNEYEVIAKDKNVYIKGNCNLTIDGNLRTFVKGNYHLEVQGDKTEMIHGDRISKITGNELAEISIDKSTNVHRDFITRIGREENRIVVDDYSIYNSAKFTLNVDDTIKIDGENDIDIDSVANTVITAVANIDIDGARIDLN